MVQIQVQKSEVKRLDARLDDITRLLNKLVMELEEISSSGAGIRLSRKARAEIDKGLKELNSGKGRTYKNVAEMDRALA
ncbi:MAG: hypothetical protein KGI00_01940 [Candidatus Micrarchaeota archaeon]|nr:hypothetical protein [Candidatus Micrarchaeota archaeon]MDE1823840.1 hypothetical protein [Candidatus Micrarchaeota archaeon]MDE1849470.1 hypothetical protein [Candidatus Micrarchaeota archaeon]